MSIDLKIIPGILLNQYTSGFNSSLINKFKVLEDSPISATNFSFCISVAAVFSSKIEGEPIELDSFIKHKNFGVAFQPDYTKKIDDLYATYLFAQNNNLNKLNIGRAHGLLTKNILQSSQQGVLRNNNMYVITKDGKIEYVAAAPDKVVHEMELLYYDINQLLIANLSFEEIFYYAALVHLVFVKIHPFNDGNGRTARLLEKWFLAEKLGGNAWYLQSEKYYYEQHQIYYNNIRQLGLDYDSLNYSHALSFLNMLPESLFQSDLF
jgi:Fic family protein